MNAYSTILCIYNIYFRVAEHIIVHFTDKKQRAYRSFVRIKHFERFVKNDNGKGLVIRQYDGKLFSFFFGVCFYQNCITINAVDCYFFTFSEEENVLCQVIFESIQIV